MNNNEKGEFAVLVDNVQLSNGSAEEKLRNRAISEGYKYRSLDESLSSEAPSENDTVKRRPDTSWSTRYNRLACLLSIALLFIALLVAIVIYQYVSKTENDKVCSTPGCVHASSFIMQTMDLTKDPCQDFYQYICGNWEQTVSVPKTKPKYTSFAMAADENNKRISKILESNSTTVKGQESETVKKIRKFYRMCLDQETVNRLDLDPLKQIIKDLGSWTISESGWNEQSWSLEETLIKMNLNDFTALFDSGVTIDDKNNTQHILMFSQPSLTLKSPEEYNSSYPKYKELKKAFLDFGATIGEFLGSDYNQTRLKIEEVYKFEQQLAEIFVPKEILRNPKLSYHKMTIKDLKRLFGNWINLDTILKKILNNDVSDSMQEIIVNGPDYLRKLGNIVTQTDKSVLANYMVLSVVSNLMGLLPVKYTKSILILEKAESGIEVLEPLQTRCIDKTNSVFGFGTGALYVQEYFSEASKKEIEDILKDVLSAFGDNLPGVEWMDSETRDKALEKLQNILPMIGYPDWILNATSLDKYYENITITEGQFFTTYLNHLRAEYQRMLNKLGTQPERKRWNMDPYEVNAYYSPGRNEIVFPAGILQKPFYDANYPRAYLYGSVGAVMGHEMTHGFDDQGRLYDKDGNMDNWWTNGSSDAFRHKTRCMKDQYSKFVFQGFNVMGDRTIGENIADNGGVKSGYHAFSKWLPTSTDKKLPGLDFTADQLFFMGFGQIWCSHYTHAYAETSILSDEHSPGPIRPNGIAINSKAFARAFNCPVGSPMNPKHKCEVW